MFDLDEAQGAAVQHGEGPLLVLAGAGSGKTRVLAARVGHLLDQGVAPERICLLTFSRRAAAEMLGRVGPRAERVWGGTFHAVGNRFLRRYGSLVGVDPSFTVLDAGDAVELAGPDGAAFAKGIASVPAAELAGRPRGVEAVHRDRLVVL